MSKPTIDYRVVIADDHELFATALAKLVKRNKSMQVTGIYSNGKELLDDWENKNPDIVFMDIQMPVMDGVEATTRIKKKYPQTKIIAVSMYDDGRHVKQMLKAGAWSFVTKDITKAIFGELIRSIIENKRYISPSAAINYTLYTNKDVNKEVERNGLNTENEPGQIPDVKITEREREVISYLVKGYSNKEIANAISRSARTVDTHKQNIMMKLNTHKSNEIVALALKYKLL